VMSHTLSNAKQLGWAVAPVDTLPTLRDVDVLQVGCMSVLRTVLRMGIQYSNMHEHTLRSVLRTVLRTGIQYSNTALVDYHEG
jgi:predicted aldo/keto reductase-like oxidoreductase